MSIFFDESYYLTQNPDVLQAIVSGAFSSPIAGVSAARYHFDTYGWKEMRDPSASFDTSFYLQNNLDVLAAGVNPYEHFINNGAAEGRVPNATLDTALGSPAAGAGDDAFDAAAYLAANTDVKAAVDAGSITAYQHWVLYGQFEGRSGAKTVTGSDLTNVGGNAGTSFNLTVGIDNLTGTANNDTFIAAEIANGTVATATLTAGDTLNGGAGTDTLKILQSEIINGLPGGASLSSIEHITLAGGKAVTFDASGIAGVTELASTQSVGALNLTAAATTDVVVSGASSTITVDGGKDITVTDATAGQDITIGATTVGAGKVTVTDTKVGNAAIAVDGGTDVSVTASGSTGGTITVGNGGAATDQPSGAVTVSSAHTAVAGTDASLASITVKGGSTVSVSQTVDTSKAATDKTGSTVTQGAVDIDAGNATTSVTVSQAASKAEVLAVDAVAGVTETASVKFGALKQGDSITIGGNGDANLEAGELRFTASKDLSAAEVAQAFANFVNGVVPTTGETQGSTSSKNGVYTTSATTSAFTGWTSGAASGDTVVFTSTTANSNVADLAINLVNTSGNSTAPAVTTTAGSNATAAVAGVLGVITGAVAIDDNATASIKTVTLDGYGATTIGANTALTKLETLSLANSGGATAGATNATVSVNSGAVTTLALALNNVKGGVTLDAALKTLNVTTAGADSSFALTAAGVEALTVAGDKAASFTADLAALKTVTVSGAAGLTLDAAVADTLESVNTSATTGKVTTTIDGVKATYTGGAGVDDVTLATSTALTKAIDLGAGDDTLSFAALAVTGSTATLSGGNGTDTISMSVAAAAGLDGSKQTFITNFEHLTLNDKVDLATANVTLDLANLGFANYVTTSGTDDSDNGANNLLILDKMASNGTVVLTGTMDNNSAGIQVNVADAATGTSDVLNVIISSAGNLAAGTLTAANVETINISTVDTEAAPQTKNVDSLTLTADKATSVTVTGAADLTLTMTGSTKVTSIDGSAMTGGLTVTSLNTTDATTIKGGAGNDVLTAATGTTADVLTGGAGDDTLTGNAGLSTLTGGAGNDLFVVNVAAQNVNSYSTITDFAAGDLIKFAGASSFQANQVTLGGGTAVFQDYANEAVNSVGANGVAWFQFNGNTYAVMDAGANTTVFTENQDFIVKITGLVDLTNASFNSTHGTIGL